MAAADVVIGHGAPELAQLVREAGETAADDGAHVQRGHFVRVLGDEVTQLVPELRRGGKARVWSECSIFTPQSMSLNFTTV